MINDNFNMKDEQLIEIEKILNAPTLYPELERKTYEKRKEELIEWLEKYGHINDRYNQYGLDIVDTNPDDYLDTGIFRKQRYFTNSTYYPQNSAFPYNFTLIMRDKRFFEMFVADVLEDEHCYSPTLGVILNDQFHTSAYGVKKGFTSLEKIFETYLGERLVFKADFGTEGKNLFACVVIDEDGFKVRREDDGMIYCADELVCKIATKNGGWIIQECIKQHPIMAQFNESSVNTLRIVTFHTGSKVLVAPVTLRFGGSNSFTDNPSSGSRFLCWTDDQGVVSEYKIDPNNKIRSANAQKGITIPYYHEAIRMAVHLHEQIPGLFTVGWDICITSNGPLVIEGNDGWDPFVTQTPPKRAMRKMYEEALAERSAFYQN